MLSNRIVFAVDYGTTFTGVAYCETSDTAYVEERIQVIQDWPSASSMIGTREKVPSEIAYSDDGVAWGATIAPHKQRHMWTKLELDAPKVGEAEVIRNELALMSLNNGTREKQPVTIVADFLSNVKEHLIRSLDRQYGRELWTTLPITLVITVPAVWSDAAKDRTLQAFEKAGFNTTGFPQLRRTVTATEPEAAALYTIRSLKGSVQDEQLAVGDGFVVCDMGGGTVDLISYRVAGITPTSIEEATIGTGAQCGGSFVDRAFLKWLEDKLGLETFAELAGSSAKNLSRTMLPPKLAKFMQAFNMQAKSGFSGTEDNYLTLPHPWSTIDDEERGLCLGELHIKPSDMTQMFAFPLRRTKELLVEQITRAASNSRVKMKYVFMVGGFAESPYMYGHIRAMTETYGIQTIRPVYAWSAIVRGAAAKGLESDGRTPVMFRKCRRHYGTECNELFVAGKHREADSYICQYDGTKRASNQMNWLMHKGQDLPTSKDVHGVLFFYCKFWAGTARTMSIPLLASNMDKAPRRTKDQNLHKVAELVINFSMVPQSEFKKKYSPSGGLYYTLDYTVEIALQSSLEFWLCVNGIKYGSVTAAYV